VNDLESSFLKENNFALFSSETLGIAERTMPEIH